MREREREREREKGQRKTKGEVLYGKKPTVARII